MQKIITNSRGFLLLTTLSCAALTACAHGFRNSPSGLDRALSVPATVTVHNQQLADMRISLVQGSAEYRLGTVSAMSSATFKVPRVVATPSEVRFLAAGLVTDDSRASEPVVVFAGDAIEFTIGQTRVLTSLLVRR